MYERFTDKAKKVIQLANQEAQRFNHEYVGTEHVLLGLISEGSGLAYTVLNKLEIDLRKVRIEVEKLVQSGPEMVTMGKLPHTPRVKEVLEYAMKESRNLNHNYIGTEHLLLGLTRSKSNESIASQGVAYLVLNKLASGGLERVRKATINSLPESIKSLEERTIGAVNDTGYDLRGKKIYANRESSDVIGIIQEDVVVIPYDLNDDFNLMANSDERITLGEDLQRRGIPYREVLVKEAIRGIDRLDEMKNDASKQLAYNARRLLSLAERVDDMDIEEVNR